MPDETKKTTQASRNQNASPNSMTGKIDMSKMGETSNTTHSLTGKIDPNEAKKITVPKAKSEGESGKTSKNNLIVVSSSYMEILIGDGYSGHPYGHVALRVMTTQKDVTFDFGRYRSTWGPFKSQGEGILNVWHNSKVFINSEKRLKRKLFVGYVYYLEPSQADAIISYFESLIAGNQETISVGVTKSTYRLASDYHPTTMNCTTLTIASAKKSGKQIVYNPGSFNKGRNLKITEKAASLTQPAPPDGIYMPMDLLAMLEGNVNCKYDKKNTY